MVVAFTICKYIFSIYEIEMMGVLSIVISGNKYLFRFQERGISYVKGKLANLKVVLVNLVLNWSHLDFIRKHIHHNIIVSK